MELRYGYALSRIDHETDPGSRVINMAALMAGRIRHVDLQGAYPHRCAAMPWTGIILPCDDSV